MGRLKPTMSVRQSERHLGRCELTFPYHHQLKDEIKGTHLGGATIPGVSWVGETKTWLYPTELVETLLTEAAHKYGYILKADIKNPSFDLTWGLHSATRDFQRWPIIKAAAHGRWIFNLDTGLGKSFCAIEVMRLRKANNILIVCPASVKLSWQDELDKWWPDHPDVEILETGKECKTATNNGIYIASYNLFEKMPLRHLDCIIFDEGHYLKESRSGRAKAARELVEQHPTSAVLLLTATPICDRPIDLWAQLNTLWPGRFGTYWNFAYRYCSIEENGYGARAVGAKDDTAIELASRLTHLSSRVTKHSVIDQLPKFDVITTRVRGKTKLNHREFIDSLKSTTNWRPHTDHLDSECTKAGAEKYDAVVEFALADLESDSHVCVLTHFKDSAREITKLLIAELGETCPVVHIDGEIETSARHRAINEAVALPKCVLVATMHSVAEGLNNLIKFTRVTFAELYWQPKTMVQTLGRFSRLSSTEPCTVRLVVLESSLDEVIAHSLMQKFNEAQKIVKASTADEKMTEALEIKMSDEDFFAEMRRAAESLYDEEI